MTLPTPGVPPSASARPPARHTEPGRFSAVVRYCTKVYAIADMETRKLRHDPTELLTRSIQPMLWLFVFGQSHPKLTLTATSAGASRFANPSRTWDIAAGLYGAQTDADQSRSPPRCGAVKRAYVASSKGKHGRSFRG